jgi:hypothetical protein
MVVTIGLHKTAGENNWGNDRFFYLKRTDEFKNDKIGQCEILSGAYYPIIR